MEENIMNDVVETAAENAVEITELAPVYTGTQVLAAAGVGILTGVIFCKLVKPAWNKIKNVFRKKDVAENNCEVVEDVEFEDVNDEKTAD